MPREYAVDTLAQHLRGQLLRPGEAGYDAARSIWNAMIDRRPALVVRARAAGDVALAVDFAREHGLELSVRGGGHHVAGAALREGAVLVDLSELNRVDVDATRRIARVEGGALMGDLDTACQASGLATPGGVVSTTGVAGLTLGGGFGWLARKHGLAADNLLSAEIVTAEGRLIRTAPDEHADLFWALRGGGGNFGAVTRFEFELHALAEPVLFGPTIYALDDAAAVLRGYRDLCAAVPRECCVWADLLTAPPLPFLPETFHGTKVLSLMQCFAGDPARGQHVLAPLRELAALLADAVGPVPYTEAQTMLDATYAHGARNYWASRNFAELGDATIDAIVELAAELPTRDSDLLVCQLGGAIDDVAPDASGYAHRGTSFIVTPGARWREPADDARCIGWAREAADRLSAGSASGAYVNFIAESGGRERDAYGANLERLRQVKRAYDPGNLFRSSQAVGPA